jgi:hypothetical protein
MEGKIPQEASKRYLQNLDFLQNMKGTYSKIPKEASRRMTLKTLTFCKIWKVKSLRRQPGE